MAPPSSSNMHFNALFGNSAQNSAIFAATTEGVGYSNQAVQAVREGRYEDAAKLHAKALELKLKAHGPDSVQAAISYNGLGEALTRCNRLEEAKAAIASALHVRDYKEFGGLELGPRDDAAFSRDNMARILEAEGKFPEARAQRLKGKNKDEIACGNYDCPAAKPYRKAQLLACGSCQSVFYHNADCQKADWTSRHKTLYKAYQANKASQPGTSAA